MFRFSAHFSVFGYPDETLFHVFEISHHVCYYYGIQLVKHSFGKFFLTAGPCCTNECIYATRATVCAKATDCTKNQTCSGLSFSCDAAEPLQNETICDQGRRVCYAGQCSTSICVKYGLEECSCTVEEELCNLCCQQNGVCTPASRLAEVK